jgi:hypothetical protein
MRILFAATIALAGTFAGTAALAQTTTTNQLTQACYGEARRQVLSGEALSNFMAQCTSGQIAPSRVAADQSQVCADHAKLLSGEAKVAAMRDCAQ